MGDDREKPASGRTASLGAEDSLAGSAGGSVSLLGGDDTERGPGPELDGAGGADGAVDAGAIAVEGGGSEASGAAGTSEAGSSESRELVNDSAGTRRNDASRSGRSAPLATPYVRSPMIAQYDAMGSACGGKRSARERCGSSRRRIRDRRAK